MSPSHHGLVFMTIFFIIAHLSSSAAVPVQTTRNHGHRHCGSSYFGRFLMHYHNNHEIFWDAAKDFIQSKFTNEEELEEIRNNIVSQNAMDTQRNDEPGCSTCTSFIQTINLLLRLGSTWEDIRAFAMPICIDLQASQGYDADDICPGMVDSFGPHAYYILSFRFPPQFVCEKLNECDRAEVYEGVPENNKRPKQGQTEEGAEKKERIKRQAPSEEERKQIRQNSLRVAHVTDIHVDEHYMEGSFSECDMPVCCRDGYGALFNSTEIAGSWGDYHCNVPPKTTELLLRKVAEFNPHMVINSGDNPDSHLWVINQEITLEVNSWVAKAIADNIPGVPAYASIGNHETFPTNLYYKPREAIQEINAGFYQDYAELSGFGDEQLETILNAAYYSVEVAPGLRLINYNSNYGATDNWYVFLNDEQQEYFDHDAYLESELAAAEARGDKVILLGHHMQGTGIVEDGQFKHRIFSRYGDSIVLHVGGHNHVDEFRLVFDPENKEARSTMFIGITMNTQTDVNPGFRIYYLDPETFIPLDYDQYYIDIPTTMSEEPTVQLRYTASTEYDLPDLSTQSMADLFSRFDEDDDLWLTFYNHRHMGARGFSECLGDCRYDNKCRMGSTDYITYRRCILGFELPFE